MWPIEARCAPIANNYFTVAINRIGTVSTLTLLEKNCLIAFTSALSLDEHCQVFISYKGGRGRDVRSRCGTKALLFLFSESEIRGLKCFCQKDLRGDILLQIHVMIHILHLRK